MQPSYLIQLKEGGIICNDLKLIDKLKKIRNFGLEKNGDILDIGFNAKINEIQSLFGLGNLKNLQKERKERNKIEAFYITELSSIEGISYIDFTNYVSQKSYQYFPIFIDNDKYKLTRDQLYVKFLKNGIITKKYFYPACHQMTCLKKTNINKADLKLTEKIADSVLCLPFYGDLSALSLSKIINIIKENNG